MNHCVGGIVKCLANFLLGRFDVKTPLVVLENEGAGNGGERAEGDSLEYGLKRRSGQG